MPICVAYIPLRFFDGKERPQRLITFSKDEDPNTVQEDVLEMTDQLIADWVESNK